MPHRSECDVLIVGGGPTGVTLGILLARTGADVLVIDKEPDIYGLPRAAHIDHEAIRIFQEIGLGQEVLATCKTTSRYDFLNASGEVLMRFDGSDRIGPGGWPAANMIHQPSIERLLRKAAGVQHRLALKTGWSWQSHETTGDHLVSRIATPEGEIAIKSRFVVGCDGARSPVRAALDIAFDDLQFDEPWLVVDTLVVDAERLPKANLQICDPARPTTCVLMGSGRHRWEFMLKPGETSEQALSDGFVESLLKPWNVDGAVTMERKAVYRFNAKVARAWRKGSVFLAGDAAHLMPPFAGQGMCSGLRDAANLSWKIAAVLAGADASLLDTYQHEREPHVRAIIDIAIMMGRTVCITDPEAARGRDAHMLAARASGQEPPPLGLPPLMQGCLLAGSPAAGNYFPQLVVGDQPVQRLDDVLGPGAWLISKSPAKGSQAVPRLHQIDLTDRHWGAFREHLSAWLDGVGADAVLVRPDRYVFGVGNPTALRDAWIARNLGA